MFGVECADNLYFATQAKTLNEGLDGELEGFIKEHKDARLIIIDTLQKVREVGGDRYSYSSDYEIVTKLKSFSDKYGVCWWFTIPASWSPRTACPRQGAKALLIERSLSKVFLRYFRESNKAEAKKLRFAP